MLEREREKERERKREREREREAVSLLPVFLLIVDLTGVLI